MRWEDRLNVFHHIYSKDYGKKKMKISSRISKQAIGKAFMDKLKDDYINDDHTFSVGI
jgi:hypothetical protein